ncbi:unnamed protein product [Lota lota]
MSVQMFYSYESLCQSAGCARVRPPAPAIAAGRGSAGAATDSVSTPSDTSALALLHPLINFWTLPLISRPEEHPAHFGAPPRHPGAGRGMDDPRVGRRGPKCPK